MRSVSESAPVMNVKDTRMRRPAAGRSNISRPRRFPSVATSLPTFILDSKTGDFEIGEDDATLLRDADVLTPLGDPRHFRVQASVHQASGHIEYCGLSEGFSIAICEATYLKPLSVPIVAENMLRVRVASDGDGEYVKADGGWLDLRGPSASIIIEPPGQLPAEFVCAGRHTAIEVHVHKDVLTQLYAGNQHELPTVVQAFIQGALNHTIAQRLTFTPQLIGLLDDLKGCSLKGHSRTLVIRSKAIDILCHALTALAEDEANPALPSASSPAVAGVLKAQRVLAENFAKPPSLDDLAREVGMSRSNLCAMFRQFCGQSVYDYVGELKMQEALAMLRSSQLTITEVGYAIGYEHPSSFSAAFQRRFGLTASEYRQTEFC
ncbi:AraC-like DNA-binding protein [Sphingopyxis sp. OAS728]|uniref:helix-turn-helix transcriptional regulator n=1 Tax=Sphingopyxis sp. OAS728 TaxID=2663823 RepID=UPI00178BA395|nr:AraC family transcriptional regulator [Sphingopyxis sp. OAS728]MBE1529610.1 AraC-like DNA-binding protein [Sphingopyxis sp. OAS728]